MIVRDRPAVVRGHDGDDAARERVPIAMVIRAPIARQSETTVASAARATARRETETVSTISSPVSRPRAPHGVMTSTKPTEALDAFFEAARANDVEGVDAVFARVERTDARCAVRVDARDARGHLATHHAAALGNLEVLEALTRRRGADADAEDAEGKTALHHAAANGRDACARYLIDSCDAWIDASDGRDETPLLAACRQGDASTVETLLARGADTAARNVDGCDAFTEALCVRGDVQTARLLVAAGVNPKRSRTRCGKSGANASRSPLNVACGMGHIDAVRFLVDECGFDASGTECGDSDYLTPLMAAALTGQIDVIEYLLVSGAAATAHVKSEDDKTAAQMLPDAHGYADVRRKIEAAASKASRSSIGRSVVEAPKVELPMKWEAQKTKGRVAADPLEVRMRTWVRAGVEKYDGVPDHVRAILEKYNELTKEIELRAFLLGIIEDEHFQEDMRVEQIRDAVDDVISNFHNVTKYHSNARVMNVLNKFRHVQRFCKDRGEKITFDDILAADEDEVEMHQERLSELQAAAGILWEDALSGLKKITNVTAPKPEQVSASVSDDKLVRRIKLRLFDLIENVAVQSFASFVFAFTLYMFWSLEGFQRGSATSIAT